MELKIATLNLCLGLKNKKLLVTKMLNEEKIDVLCIQETEIDISSDVNLLKIPGFELELELNSTKSRVAVYVNNNVKYVRKTELEGVDSHLLVIDLIGKNKTY